MSKHFKKMKKTAYKHPYFNENNTLCEADATRLLEAHDIPSGDEFIADVLAKLNLDRSDFTQNYRRSFTMRRVLKTACIVFCALLLAVLPMLTPAGQAAATRAIHYIVSFPSSFLTSGNASTNPEFSPLPNKANEISPNSLDELATLIDMPIAIPNTDYTLSDFFVVNNQTNGVTSTARYEFGEKHFTLIQQILHSPSISWGTGGGDSIDCGSISLADFDMHILQDANKNYSAFGMSPEGYTLSIVSYGISEEDLISIIKSLDFK